MSKKGLGARNLAGVLMATMLTSLMTGAFVQSAGAESNTIPTLMTKVATHQWAAAQPTADGRRLIDVQIRNGRIWAGYGDYTANTGPIVLASIDAHAEDQFVSSFTMDTEAAYNLRTIGDRLVIPATDPIAMADFATDSPWTESRPIGAEHIFDAVTVTGSDLWMVGSKGSDAVAWRSLDGGRTWTEELRVEPWVGLNGEYVRFYFAAVVGGELFVQAKSNYGYEQPTSMVFGANGWREGPSVLPPGSFGAPPVAYEGGVVFHRIGHGIESDVYFFDGVTTRSVGVGYDFAVDGHDLYVLESGGRVVGSRSFGQTTTVASGPASAISIAVDASSIVVGTSNSEVWSADRGQLSDETATVPVPTTSPDATSTTLIPAAEKFNSSKGQKPADDHCPQGWMKKGRC